MKTIIRTTILLAFMGGLSPALVYAQSTAEHVSSIENQPVATIKETDRKPDVSQTKKQGSVVIITGARFSYPLLQKWIDDYNKTNPDAQVIIESRGSADPAQYDVLAEVYDQDPSVKASREYIYVGRYAVLPVANSRSSFSKIYADKGLNKDLINQLFFHDTYSDRKEQAVKAPFTVYTRLQKAGAPIVFTRHFGFEQKDIKGKAIAGSDENLLKALLRDSSAVTYLPLTLLYDHTSRKQVSGVTVLPVDANGNGRVNDDEKFYDNLDNVIQHLEGSRDLKNIPVAYLHLSVDKENAKPEAIEFLRWVRVNGQKDLHDFGYLNPDENRDEASFEKFASKQHKP